MFVSCLLHLCLTRETAPQIRSRQHMLPSWTPIAQIRIASSGLRMNSPGKGFLFSKHTAPEKYDTDTITHIMACVLSVTIRSFANAEPARPTEHAFDLGHN